MFSLKKNLVKRVGRLVDQLGKRRGETLVEAMVAVSILILVIAPAAALQVTSLRLIDVNRMNLVADGLAQEGIEMMRNIRDTNFLKFSSRSKDCWNALPETVGIASCQLPAGRINGNNAGTTRHRLEYIPYPDCGVGVAPPCVNAGEPRWRLSAPQVAALSPNLDAMSDAFYLLNLDALDETISPECGPVPAPNCHRHFIDDSHVYTPVRGVVSPFYREIELEHVELQNPTGAPDGPDAMKVISRVRYLRGGTVYAVERATLLTRQTQ